MLLRALTTMVLLSTFPASADGLENWGSSGDWTIFLDPSAGNGCLMQKTFDDNTVIQVGGVPNRGGGFLAAYNPAWNGIEDGVEGVVRIDFGDQLFEGSIIGKILNGVPGGYAYFDNPNFIDEFGKRNSLILTGKKTGHRVEINLSGTGKAIKAVLSCQKQHASG